MLATENVELMHEYCPKHLCTETPKLILNENSRRNKQKIVYMGKK